MANIFISYRRDDSAGYAGRLYDTMNAQLGEGMAFMDVEGIGPGQNFANVLEENLENCVALVAVIGPRWLTITNDVGQRRLDEPGDFTRMEIASALRRSIPIFPLLVAGAKMPIREQVPEELALLTSRQAVSAGDVYFQRDVSRLMDALQILLPKPQREANFAGRWEAAITYEWGDHYQEVFQFEMEEDDVSGTASYLGTNRGFVAGTVKGNKIEFTTKSYTMLGDKTYEEKHQYRGLLSGDDIRFTLMTDSGYDSRQPQKFIAKRAEGSSMPHSS
jgi:hypothetical protein